MVETMDQACCTAEGGRYCMPINRQDSFLILLGLNVKLKYNVYWLTSDDMNSLIRAIPSIQSAALEVA